MSMVIDENGSDLNFELGDLVFAKVKGYQHWPAEVRQLPADEKPGFYCVNFFGSYEIGYVKAAQMVLYNNASALQFGSAKIKSKMSKQNLAKFATAMQEIEKAQKAMVPNGQSKTAEPDENGVNGEADTSLPVEAKRSRKRRISKTESEEKTPKIETSAKRRKDEIVPTPPARRRGRPSKKSLVNEELPEEKLDDETQNENSEESPPHAENSLKNDTLDSSLPVASTAGSIRNRSARRVSIPKKFADGNTLLYESVPSRATLPSGDVVKENVIATVVAPVESENTSSTTLSALASEDIAADADTIVPTPESNGRKRRFLGSVAVASKKNSPSMKKKIETKITETASLALPNGLPTADETGKTEPVQELPIAEIVKTDTEKLPDHEIVVVKTDAPNHLKPPVQAEPEPVVEMNQVKENTINGEELLPDEKSDTQTAVAAINSVDDSEIQPTKNDDDDQTKDGIKLVPNNCDGSATADAIRLDQKTDEKDTEEDYDLTKDEEPVYPVDMDVIERNESVYSQDGEDSAPRRSRLARNIEPPMRYKDTVDTLTLKPVAVKPGRKSTNLKEEPVASSGRIQDIKLQPSSSHKPHPIARAKVNRDKNSIEMDELDHLEDNQLESEARERIESLRKAQLVMECIIKIIEVTSIQHQDFDVALEMLAKISEKDAVTKDMLKSYPEIVEVIRKIQHFVGNSNLRMSKQQKMEMPTKTAKIRDAAKNALDYFKELMTTNSKPYAVLLMEQQRKQWSNEEV